MVAVSSIPLVSGRRVCHFECDQPLLKRGRLPRHVELNPEAEESMPPALRERHHRLREIQFIKDYKGPMAAGACLG